MRSPFCRHCGKDNRFTAEEKSQKARDLAVKKRAEGKNLGRPRLYDYEEIRRLRKGGMALDRIAMKVGCPIGSVQWALKSEDSGDTPVLPSK